MKNNRRQERYYFGAAIVAFAFCLLVIIGPKYLAYWKYSPKVGDIIFQSLPHSPLVNSIEGVTKSPFSHCGLVAQDDRGSWIVYEALDGVEVTPLREFVFRGRKNGFAVYRLKRHKQEHITGLITSTKKFLGRPYDFRYRMDDENIYCSELIYKAYAGASNGESLGELDLLGNLNWAPYEETIRHYENGPVPLEREMITPVKLAQAKQLECVYHWHIRIPGK